MMVLMGLQTTAAVRIYLETKDLLPGSPESLFEMGFVLFKRSSIFFISGILIFNSFGLMMVYFIVFGDTMSSVVRNLSNETITAEDFFGKRVAYVIILGSLLVPLVLKKELNEISILSVLLFVSIFTFIILTIVQLGVHGIQDFNEDFRFEEPRVFYGDYFKPKLEINFIKAISIMLVSYSCQQNLFPIYSELKVKTNSECSKSFAIASLLVGALYITLAVVSLYMFGSEVESSILENVGHECSKDPLSGELDCPWESIVLRFMFLVVIACHVPFIFFSGKEGMLIIIDEIDRKSISTALQSKLDLAKKEG
mmetsp:Transcript_12699/g.21385  ORF Transcript_12699/g.21385 Transcript_12699/m.21385 type:complete len:311 (+) Transcript_12699:175-1107(+)